MTETGKKARLSGTEVDTKFGLAKTGGLEDGDDAGIIGKPWKSSVTRLSMVLVGYSFCGRVGVRRSEGGKGMSRKDGKVEEETIDGGTLKGSGESRSDDSD